MAKLHSQYGCVEDEALPTPKYLNHIMHSKWQVSEKVITQHHKELLSVVGVSMYCLLGVMCECNI